MSAIEYINTNVKAIEYIDTDVCVRVFHNSITNKFKVVVGFMYKLLHMLEDEYDIQIKEEFSDKIFQILPFDGMIYYELTEDDIEYIVDLLKDSYHFIEDQKFKVIRESLKLEKYASSKRLAYSFYSFENDYIEDELEHFDDYINEMKQLISKFQRLIPEITTRNRYVETEYKTMELIEETKKKCSEWGDTKKFILDKIEEVQRTRKLLKKNETDPIVILIQSEKLDKDENYWKDMLKRVIVPINEYNNTLNSLYHKLIYYVAN